MVGYIMFFNLFVDKDEAMECEETENKASTKKDKTAEKSAAKESKPSKAKKASPKSKRKLLENGAEDEESKKTKSKG